MAQACTEAKVADELLTLVGVDLTSQKLADGREHVCVLKHGEHVGCIEEVGASRPEQWYILSADGSQRKRVVYPAGVAVLMALAIPLVCPKCGEPAPLVYEGEHVTLGQVDARCPCGHEWVADLLA